jgi:serine protease Do
MVKELLPSLTEDGKVRRSAMGIVVASVQAEDAARLALPNRTGALVTRVTPGGPGDRAGLQVDDVIMRFDEQPGSGPNRLRWQTSIAGVGKKAHLEVRRARRLIDVTVTLGALTPEAATAAAP